MTSDDEFPYDPLERSVVSPAEVFATAARFGVASDSYRDALDLGCGTGRNLVALRAALAGRVVGVDLSASACDLARSRAPNAEVICADLLNLNARDLGQFDVIYCLGVLYVVPHAVREHVLGLIRECLRPGGVALLAYYSGGWHAMRTGLHRWVRDKTAGLSPREAVTHARVLLKSLAAQADNLPAPLDHCLREVILILEGRDDVVFWNEVFNPHFCTLDTAQLGAAPLSFLDHTKPSLFSFGAAPEERALSASICEALGGGYNYGVFTR
jgi:SAM-dependent methyltransferase